MSRLRALLVIILAVGILGFGLYSGVRSRRVANTELKRATADAAVEVVKVVSPTLTEPTQEILLPGTTQAFTDASLFARTNGYVKAWHFDIGARVTKGQLLAEIETPEVDQQLQQARADLETAQANLKQAEITAERWKGLLESGSVSQQETDVAVNALGAMKATVNSNAANVRRLEQLQGFEKIYAPFDGIITARNLDIGVLINAGSTPTPSQELFHIAAIDRLRVFVAVPEVYAPVARPGAQATLTLDAFPGRTFRGTLVRTANAIDLTARTLLVEVDVDNPRGELLPGAYVFVHLQLPKEVRSVTIPVNTLIFRAQGLQVAVVREGQAKLVPVTIGRDHGTFVEIVSGLQPSDQVIVAPPDSLTTGTPVRMKPAGTANAPRP
jgi:RND family efflux transporter MFP subunit